jgi:hypothetical protein
MTPNTFQIQAIDLGLTQDQLAGHNWDNLDTAGYTAVTTLNYLKKQISQKEDPSTAFDKIKGLNGLQIQAIDLGLTREQLAGHNWDNRDTAGYTAVTTLNYLKKQISQQEDPSRAFDKIKGLNGLQIQAIDLGLTREQLAGHNWNNRIYELTADKTLEYLRKCPDELSKGQAIENIKTLNGYQIKDIMDLQKEAMENGLTVLQVYVVNLNREQVDKIKNGETYENVVPLGHNKILLIEERKQFGMGATAGFINSINQTNGHGQDLSKILSNHLTVEKQILLAQVNKTASESARASGKPNSGNSR